VVCFTRGEKEDEEILDLASLTININHQGVAIMTATVLSTSTDSPAEKVCRMDLGGGSKFSGFLENSTIQPLAGTEYMEHRMTFRGEIV
jgi:hypothetical protein